MLSSGIILPAGSGRRFHPRLWPTLVAAAGCLALIGLGSWQLERLQWKEQLVAQRTAQLAAPPEVAARQQHGLGAMGFSQGARHRHLPP